MNRRKYALKIAVAELISLLSAFYTVSSTKTYPASYSVFGLFSGVLVNSKFGILTLLFVLFPTLLLYFCLVEYMQDDYAICCVYIFTRSANRAKWFIKKAAGLFCWIIIFYSAEFLLLLFVAALSGSVIDFPAAVSVFLWTLLFNTLAAFMLLLPMNLLALKAGTVISYFVGIFVYLFLLVTAMYGSAALSRWLPASQGMYAWHQTLFTEIQSKFDVGPLLGFNVWFSVAYMLIVVAAEMIIGVVIIKRMDLLSVPEGEN